MNYNLLEEPWMPVLYKDGNVTRVNILDAFDQAGRIREIAASNPMDRVAVLRFLLALLYWCRGNPPDDADSIPSFPSDWFTKLCDSRDCFNLLGNGKRFYQYGGDCGTKKSVNYLMQEVPTGTNAWHFRHSTDCSDGLCRACCALGLLRLPPFATSGGKGKPPAINQKPPVYIIPLGVTLRDTLMLSWRSLPDDDLGTAAWERPDLKLPKHGRVPLLTGLTWVPRRVWLDEPEPAESTCISCGQREPIIRECIFAPIGSMKAEDRSWIDPHTIPQKKGALQTRDALGSVDAAADEWTGMWDGILGLGESALGKSFWAVAFATVQNDKYLESRGTEFKLPVALDGGASERGVEAVGRWRREAGRLALKARPKDEPRKRDHSEILPAVAAIRPQAEARVATRAAQLIQGGDDAWEQAAREYAPMMEAISRSLSPGYNTAALRRRREIANVRPDIRPKATAARKGGPNNGGGK